MLKRKKGLRILMLAGLFFIAFLMYLISSFYGKIIKDLGVRDVDTTTYRYHYVMIVDILDSLFWNDVYENVKEEAAALGAYVELKGRDRSSEYNIVDFMDMSLAAGVDGIILEYTGEKGLDERINAAYQKGIPVVTMLNDAEETQRISHVGVNAYQLGQVYGTRILEMIPKELETVRICILLPDYSQSLLQSQIFYQINSNMQPFDETNATVLLEEVRIPPNEVFESEEKIWELFRGELKPPDIIVCMDEMETAAAYQAVIAYNRVGKTQVIGYYKSNVTLTAVADGIFSMTLVIDTKQMGKYAVAALAEFTDEGRANSFYTVDLDFITKDTFSRAVESE